MTYPIVEVQLPSFSVAKLNGKASCPGYTSNYLTGRWFGPRTELESVERRAISIRAFSLAQFVCTGNPVHRLLCYIQPDLQQPVFLLNKMLFV